MPDDKKEVPANPSQVVRDALYEQYQKANNPEPEKKVEPEPKKEEAAPEPEKKEPPAEPEPKIPDTPETPAKKEPTEPEPKKDVPHALFHEEREKRKALAARLKEVEDREKAYLDDLQKFKTETENLRKKPPLPEGPLDDVDGFVKKQAEKISELETEISKIKNIETNRSTVEEKRKQDDFSRKIQEDVAKTNVSLEAEGFPGFEMFKDQVGQEVLKLIAEDPLNKDVYANPDGWKRLYKERVYPSIKSVFTKDKKGEKEKLKEKAALEAPSGADAQEKKSKEGSDWTKEDYFAWRQKRHK